MTNHEFCTPVDNPGSSTATTLRTGWLRRLGTRITGWLGTAADYYAAAATYEQLSRLSDAELQRRGLNRATLARDACRASEPRFERSASLAPHQSTRLFLQRAW